LSRFAVGQRLGLGTAQLGASGSRQEAYALLDAYVDLGGRLIDTAAVYSDWIPGERGRSETIIGEWLRLRSSRAKVIISTKGGHPPLTDRTKGRLDAAALRHDVEQSLRRLQTDHIDLYLLHRDDPKIPVAEIFGTLGQFVQDGKIGAVGVSNWDVSRISEARMLAAGPVVNQLLGNILCLRMNAPADSTVRVLNASSFRQAETEDLTLMLFSSQCLGTFDEAKRGAPPRDYDNPACAAQIDAIRDVASQAEVSPDLLAVAFLRQFSPRILPLVGPRTVAQVQVSMRALEVRLDDETVTRLAQLSGFDTLPA
jgi:aryl-alcohol dehydrogenase-like predicted oxidoreductase